MQVLSRPSRPEGPENLVHRLVAQLSRHVLWDSLLLFLPPAAAVICLLSLLLQAAWLSRTAAILMMILTFGLGVLAVLLHRQPYMPSARSAAQLIDRQSGAKDHFLTLATIDSARQPSLLLTRLRRQTEGYLNRVQLRRDFRYRVKRSAYWSLGSSLIAMTLVYLMLPTAESARHTRVVQERLREIAQQMESRPSLKTLAEELKILVSKLDDPNSSPDNNQALAQNVQEKVKDQQKKEEQKDNRDLLDQAASALSGLEKQQQVASGQDQQKDQQKGGGEVKSNMPQDGKGESKGSQGGSGETKGESAAQSQEKMDQGKSAQANPKEQGPDKSQSGDAKNQNEPDPNQSSKDSNKEKASKAKGASKDGAGKQQSQEEPPPQGGPPEDRFYKSGEGKDGLAAKGYVTVQMPEDLVADSKGESRATKESKNSRARSQVPVSNVPLPAHVPNAPAEKQQVPIEYRGVIR